MSSKVYANGMSISNKGSGAMSTVFPDVCKTPVGSAVVPIPYPNTAKSADVADGTKTVKIEGEMGTNKGCNYSTSTGDEAGSSKGLISGKTKGKAEFMLSSFDVKLEGKNACRMGDMMTHNDKNALG